jgi:hypothetical protein
MVAPGDGVSAAEAAVRTLRVAAQYIQYRKDQEQQRSPQREEELLHAQEDQPPHARDKAVVLSNIVPTTWPR